MIIPASLFTVLAVFFIALSTFNIGVGSNKAYATEASSNTRVNLEIASRINISSPGTTTMTCSSANTLCTSTASITVETNNATGYTLQMNATSDYSNALTNTAASATVPTLSGSYSSANFPVDYWGYTGGIDKSSETGGYNCASNYCPVLAYQSTESNYAPNHAIRITDAPGTSSVTNITFGAKTSKTKPAGTYSTSVTFTAVANYVPYVPPVTTFQEFDSSICASAPVDETFTLTDIRDGGTSYTVAKLQDGNCWMTQNLELGTSGQSLNLTNATSNVSSSGYTLTLDTEQSHYKGDTTTKYGNFYTRAQATAGTGTTTAGEDAPNDICPKNWRLPSAGTNTTTGNEFYTMLNHYLDSSKWGGSYWSGVTTTQFTNAPVSLVFSGNWNSGSLSRQGDYGYWWSSTSGGSSSAFSLNADSEGDVRPRYFNLGQTVGFSVRCLVPGA